MDGPADPGTARGAAQQPEASEPEPVEGVGQAAGAPTEVGPAGEESARVAPAVDAPPAPPSVITPEPVDVPTVPVAAATASAAPDLTAAPPPAGDVTTTTRSGGGRGRSILVGLLFLVTCLMMVVSVGLVWAHQVALNTDRYVTVVSRVAENPAVIAGASDRIANQIVTAVDLDARLTDALPGPTKSVAPLIVNTVRDSLATRIERGLASDEFQQVWIASNRIAHQAVVKLLRGQSDVVTTQDGYVTINLLPIVEKILLQLQQSGIIPASIAIPDLSDPAAIQGSIARLETALGRDIPDDFGQIKLVESDKLARAQAGVTIFDIVVVVAVLLTLALLVLTILLARRRLRMAVALAIGGFVSWLLAIQVISLVEGAVVDAIATGDGSVGRAIVDDLTKDLTTWLLWLAVAAAVIAVVLYFVSRPAWLFGRTDREEAAA